MESQKGCLRRLIPSFWSKLADEREKGMEEEVEIGCACGCVHACVCVCGCACVGEGERKSVRERVGRVQSSPKIKILCKDDWWSRVSKGIEFPRFFVPSRPKKETLLSELMNHSSDVFLIHCSIRGPAMLVWAQPHPTNHLLTNQIRTVNDTTS